MKNYKVIATEDVQNDLDNFVYYLLVEKLNDQAAKAVLSLKEYIHDFETLYKAVVKNEEYKDVSRDEVMKYYNE